MDGHSIFHKLLAGLCVQTHIGSSLPLWIEPWVEYVGANVCLAAMSTRTEWGLSLERGEKSDVGARYALLTQIDMLELEVSVASAHSLAC